MVYEVSSGTELTIIAGNDVDDTLFTVGDKAVAIFSRRVQFIGESGVRLERYLDPTYTGGTPNKDYWNINDNFDNTDGSVTFIEGYTLTDPGTLKGTPRNYLAGVGQGNSIVVSNTEDFSTAPVILQPNSSYLFRTVNLSTSPITIAQHVLWCDLDTLNLM